MILLEFFLHEIIPASTSKIVLRLGGITGGSLVTLRAGMARDHWVGSLVTLTAGMARDHWATSLVTLRAGMPRDHWAGSLSDFLYFWNFGIVVFLILFYSLDFGVLGSFYFLFFLFIRCFDFRVFVVVIFLFVFLF